ncbi:hypothetical protein [Rhodococcus sp. YH3-3]|uniref:AMP-binding enzyme n=1 Tax=Rhodococcus sp. YH3-3 TaxID=1803579 RepID=UPI001EE70E30|nr:hypothetical protein [Rhodococcus sp. YH3-3]
MGGCTPATLLESTKVGSSRSSTASKTRSSVVDSTSTRAKSRTHSDIIPRWQHVRYSVPDSQWGEAVTAAVVLKTGWSVTPDQLIAHVRSHKGPIWAPKEISILEALPLTALGKIDKKALRGASPT